MRKKISQREIDRRYKQAQAQWDKDNPGLRGRMNELFDTGLAEELLIRMLPTVAPRLLTDNYPIEAS